MVEIKSVVSRGVQEVLGKGVIVFFYRFEENVAASPLIGLILNGVFFADLCRGQIHDLHFLYHFVYRLLQFLNSRCKHLHFLFSPFFGALLNWMALLMHLFELLLDYLLFEVSFFDLHQNPLHLLGWRGGFNE